MAETFDIMAILEFWWRDLGLDYKGVNLGDCLAYDLDQILIRVKEQAQGGGE